MTYYLIDPKDKTVTSFDEALTLKVAYARIGAGCNLIQQVPRALRPDDLYVDEEGLLRPGPALVGLFYAEGWPGPLVGRGIVSGLTADGDWCSPLQSLEEVRDQVTFP